MSESTTKTTAGGNEPPLDEGASRTGASGIGPARIVIYALVALVGFAAAMATFAPDAAGNLLNQLPSGVLEGDQPEVRGKVSGEGSGGR